jgi:hypothetical protein
MEKQVLVYINKPQQFIDWRKVAPEMPLMVSLPGGVKDTNIIDVTFFIKANRKLKSQCWVIFFHEVDYP